jgi:hypothetical protein
VATCSDKWDQECPKQRAVGFELPRLRQARLGTAAPIASEKIVSQRPFHYLVLSAKAH